MYNFSNSAVIYWIRLPEHTEPSTEGYIGVSKFFENRMDDHRSKLINNTHANPHLQHIYNKVGWDYLVKDILLVGEEDFCYAIEVELRPDSKIGWNIAKGGHRGPGWPKGKKRPEEWVLQQKLKRQPIIEQRRKELAKTKQQLKEAKRQAKEAKLLTIAIEKQQAKKAKQQAKEAKQQAKEAARKEKENLAKKPSYRKLCSCGRAPVEINYYKAGKPYYRSKCGLCNKGVKNPRWATAGYNKKSVCEKCGIRSLHSEVFRVFHVDGNLDNCRHSNLKTVCLNCSSVLHKEGIRWKQGDLTPDL